jgi:hypothetical protein
MAPAVREHPGTAAHSHQRRNAVDERILAQRAQHSPTDQEHKGREERNCFYCLSEWVFFGSLDHDGREVYESVRCRRCKGTGRMNR